MTQVTLESFVRQLPQSVRRKLGRMLDAGNLWEELACVIPSSANMLFQNQNSDYELRYSADAVAHLQKGRSGTENLLKDWGTQNCQIRHLIKALLDAQLLEAVQYLRHDVLRLPDPQPEPVPVREPQEAEVPFCTPIPSPVVSPDGQGDDSRAPGVPEMETRHETLGEEGRQSKQSASGSMEERESSLPSGNSQTDTQPGDMASHPASIPSSGGSCEATLGSSEISSPEIISQPISSCPRKAEESSETPVLLQMEYAMLKNVTDNFNEKHVTDNGNLIGTGGFGDVFLGVFRNGLKVAVKRLKNNSEEDRKQFNTEVKTLCEYRHEHVVTLMGFSLDGERMCLVYCYMPNGSLEERLACDYNTPPLSVAMRIEIARGTAKGIAYLHSKGVTHRDIKTANILLDAEYKPKVGDFATAKVAPSGMTSKILSASVVIGTQAYLAPEALNFDIHPGLDIFSFGVVLLELITGLPVLDDAREDRDLKLHIQEYCTPYEEDGQLIAGDIYDLRDKRVADGWNDKLVRDLYALAGQCLEPSRKRRIRIDRVLKALADIYLDDVA